MWQYVHWLTLSIGIEPKYKLNRSRGIFICITPKKLAFTIFHCFSTLLPVLPVVNQLCGMLYYRNKPLCLQYWQSVLFSFVMCLYESFHPVLIISCQYDSKTQEQIEKQPVYAKGPDMKRIFPWKIYFSQSDSICKDVHKFLLQLRHTCTKNMTNNVFSRYICKPANKHKLSTMPLLSSSLLTSIPSVISKQMPSSLHYLNCNWARFVSGLALCASSCYP